jgi:hypothetical protein
VAYRFAAADNDAERRQLLTAGAGEAVHAASIEARQTALAGLGPQAPASLLERPQPTAAQVAQLHSEAIRRVTEGKEQEGMGGAELLPWVFGGADSCRPGAGASHTSGKGLSGEDASAASASLADKANHKARKRFAKPAVPKLALGQASQQGTDTEAWQKQMVNRADLAQTDRPAVEASRGGRAEGDPLSMHQFRLALTWREELRRRQVSVGRAHQPLTAGRAADAGGKTSAVGETRAGGSHRSELARLARKSPERSEEAKLAAKVGLASVMHTLFDPSQVLEPEQHRQRVHGVASGLGGASAPSPSASASASVSSPSRPEPLPGAVKGMDLVGAFATGDEFVGRVPRGEEYEAVLTERLPGNQMVQEYFDEWHSAKERWNGRERALAVARHERVQLEKRRARRDGAAVLTRALPEVLDVRDAVRGEADAVRGRAAEARAGAIAWVELTVGSAPQSRTTAELQRLMLLQHEQQQATLRASAEHEKLQAEASGEGGGAGTVANTLTAARSDLARGGSRQTIGNGSSTPIRVKATTHPALQPFPVPANPTAEELEHLMSPLNRDRLVAELAVREHAGVGLAGGAMARAFRDHPGMQRRVDAAQIAVREEADAKKRKQTAKKRSNSPTPAESGPPATGSPRSRPRASVRGAASAPTASGQAAVSRSADALPSQQAEPAPAADEDAAPGAEGVDVAHDVEAGLAGPEPAPPLGKSVTAAPRHHMPSLRLELTLKERLQRAKANLYDAVGSVDDVMAAAMHTTAAIMEGQWIRIAAMQPLPEELAAAEANHKQHMLAEQLGREAPAPSMFRGQQLPPGLRADQLSKAVPLSKRAKNRSGGGVDDDLDDEDGGGGGGRVPRLRSGGRLALEERNIGVVGPAAGRLLASRASRSSQFD